jgi:hypothetical protein
VTGFSKEGGAMYVTAEARWSAREGERKKKKKVLRAQGVRVQQKGPGRLVASFA